MSRPEQRGVAGLWRVLRERMIAVRNRLLASERFQRGAAAFPPTRPIARRRASELFDLCAGFVYSQVLLATVRLGLLEMLRDGPVEQDTLAERLSLSRAATLRLLGATGALRLTQALPDGRHVLGQRGAVLAGMPGVAAMIEHHAVLYRDLEDPVALLRGEGDTALGAYWPYAGHRRPEALSDDDVAPYSQLMALSQDLVSAEVLDVASLAETRHLLDVGGGEGRFLCNAARRWPGLRGTVADLPAVANRARARFREAGLDDRLSAVGVNFLQDVLPTGADTVSLVRVIHDHDDADVLQLLARVRDVLPPGGRLLVAEPMSGTRGAEAMGDAYFGFYLLAMGKGRPRTAAAISSLVEAAGFDSIRRLPGRNPMQATVLSARRTT